MSFKDNSGQVKSQMAGNVKAALAATGVEAVGLTVKQMQSGYGKPIRQTGDLMRDVSSEVDGDVVNVGNSLGYAPPVHEGTSKMQGRPYLKDAIMGGKDRLQQVAQNELKKGY
jgi:hypothetical protein